MPVVDPKVDVTEKVWGPDDKRIKVGTIVRRPKMPHPVYGVLPSIAGEVVRIYRLPGDDRVRVDIKEKKNLRVVTVFAETLRRSTCTVPKFLV